jgi:hypothetical protein
MGENNHEKKSRNYDIVTAYDSKWLAEFGEEDTWDKDLKAACNGVGWETFMTIIEAASRGETPDWLILKGGKREEEAARVWNDALKEIESRKAAEQEKIRREQIREAALNKLSAEEKKILGL